MPPSSSQPCEHIGDVVELVERAVAQLDSRHAPGEAADDREPAVRKVAGIDVASHQPDAGPGGGQRSDCQLRARRERRKDDQSAREQAGRRLTVRLLRPQHQSLAGLMTLRGCESRERRDERIGSALQHQRARKTRYSAVGGQDGEFVGKIGKALSTNQAVRDDLPAPDCPGIRSSDRSTRQRRHAAPLRRWYEPQGGWRRFPISGSAHRAGQDRLSA